MEETVEILDIAHLLQKKFALVTGGIDRDGYPMLMFYDVGVDVTLVENGEFLKLIEYLSTVTRLLWEIDYVTVVIDRRTSKWQDIKSLLLKLKGVNSLNIHKLLVLKPKGFFQKHFNNESKELRDIIDGKIIFLETRDSLFNHIEVRQLPEDLGGVFEFNHIEWVEHRTAIERFEITCKKTKSRLLEVRLKFNRIEPLSSQKEIEEIRSLHSKVVSDVDDDLKCSKEIAQTLEAIVKKPFSTKEVKPLSHFNFDYLEKWISNLDSMREELQALWKIHDKYLEDCSVLCQFELDYSEVSKAVLEITAEVKDRTDIGMTLEAASDLMSELESFRDKTKTTYERIKVLRETGFKLIDNEHYALSSIKLNCDEIKRLCDEFEDAVNARKNMLQTNIDVLECLNQLDSWSKRGLDLLASQSLDEIQLSEGASKALEQIERFVSNGEGLSFGKINKLNRLSRELDNRVIDGKVKDAMTRTEEITELLDKRENSLKKLSKPPARPVQPVKAIQKPASPLEKRQKANAQMTSNPRTKKDSKEFKKNIDVVVTSQPLKKRMSFRKSKRALLAIQDSSGSPVDYEEEDKELIKKSRLVIQEFIDTERDYVNDIECVIEGYYDAFDDPNFNIPVHLRGKKNIIFGNIEGIYRFHKTVFLKDLENCLATPYKVGLVFADKREEFQLYAIYCKNKPNSEALTKELEQKSTFLKDFQTKLGHKLPLYSYLLKPVQRITKYQLLLQEMIKYTSKRNPALMDLQDAVKTVKKIVRNVNDVMHSTGLTGCPEDVSSLGKLILQDSFVVWNVQKNMLKNITKLRGKNRQVFLYEKAIIFTRKEPREFEDGKEEVVYQFKSLVKMSDTGLTESVKDNPCKFEVWVQGRNEVHLLQGSSKDVKESWVAEIRKLLVEQLNSAKEEKVVRQASIKSKSSLAYVDPKRRGSVPNITSMPLSAPPAPADKNSNRFRFSALLTSPTSSSQLSSPIRDQRRGSDMDLWRSAETSPDVYLSPATASEFLDLDSTECWSDSEFEDDELDDDGLFYSKHEQDRLSLSTNNSNSSEMSTRRTFLAVADYESVEANELTLCAGDHLELVQTGSDGWWFMRNLSSDKDGWTPSSYVEEQSLDSGILVDDQSQKLKSTSPRPRVETTV